MIADDWLITATTCLFHVLQQIRCVCVCLNMSEYVSFLLNMLEFCLHDTTLGFSAFGDAKRVP